jgi:hypothetical protein
MNSQGAILFITVHMETKRELKGAYISVISDGIPRPMPVVRALLKLCNDLSLARRRRKLTQDGPLPFCCFLHAAKS